MSDYEKGRANALAKIKLCLDRIVNLSRQEEDEPDELSDLFDTLHAAMLLRHAIRLSCGVEPYREE